MSKRNGLGIGVLVAGGFLMAGVSVAVSIAASQAPGASRAAAAASAPPPASAARASKLFKDSRQSLAIARAQGRTEVVLLVAAVPGGAAAVAQEVARVGGDVRYRDDEVDYLRVKIPIDRASEFAESDRIAAVAMDRDDSYPGRLMGDGASAEGEAAGGAMARAAATAARSESMLLPAQSAPASAASASDEQWPPKSWGDYPLRHPYSPLKDIAAADLLKQHPTYDGRGVGIALLDGNLDALLPEFQTAYTVDGKTVPKIADFLNVTDPRDDAELMPQWVDMKAQVTASGGKVAFQGKSFTAPRNVTAGALRIGFFDERRFNNPSNAFYIDQDIDRNGNPKGDDGLFGVLWDERTNDVWVDTNRDLSFADEKALTDYIKRPEFGVFGKDNPATVVRDSVAFAVQTDAINKFVSINVGLYQHATIIMGSVVGNRAPAGRLDGVAPGARLISICWGVGDAHAMVEGLIVAFKHPLVDLIVLEQHVGVASVSYLLADANHPVSVIAQRLAQKYKKLMFVPGANAPGSAIVAEDGLAPAAMSVGGYQSRESYRLNAGIVPEFEDNLHWGGLSHGPSGNGALKPDILAPSGQMSTDPGYRRGSTIRGLFQLPPGYSVDGGTSTATPMAAGAAALVVSAAKQAHVPFDAFTLKAALTGSGRAITRLPANEQGNGLVQVGPAFELLKKLNGAVPVSITSRAPVKTRLSARLQTPDEGVGLYEREGWKAGDRGTRTITFTRTSGPAEPMTFTLTWERNDGTFSSAASIALPLNKPVPLPVAIAVKDPGLHSAILTLDHPSVPGHAHRVLTTVVAPLAFTAENKHTVTTEVVVSRPGDRGVFLLVPPGVPAIAFSSSVEQRRMVGDDGANDTVRPETVRMSLVSPGREYLFPCAFTAPSQPCTVARPEPGVWELNAVMNAEAREFDPDRPNPLKPTPVKLTAKLVGIDVTPTAASSSAALKAGEATAASISLTNRFSAVSKASAVTTALASAYQARREIARGEQHVYEVTVPKGATSLRARVSDVADANADLDLYLLDCTARQEGGDTKAETTPKNEKNEKETGNKAPVMAPPACAPRAKAASVDGGGEVEVVDPAPGRWVLVVDAYAVPSGKTMYGYVDLFTHPKLGTLAMTDAPDAHDTGAAWTAPGHAWASTLPDSPRTLLGRIVVTSADLKDNRGVNVTIGSADLPLGAPAASTTAAGAGRGR